MMTMTRRWRSIYNNNTNIWNQYTIDRLENLWYWVSNDLNWSLVTDSLKPWWSWWRGALLWLRNSEQGIQFAKLLQFIFDWMSRGPKNPSITINHRKLITGNRYFVIPQNDSNRRMLGKRHGNAPNSDCNQHQTELWWF